MQRLVTYTEQVPQNIKIASDIGVWGMVAVGWLGVIQPWLTALATLLAITWTSMQIYSWAKRKK